MIKRQAPNKPLPSLVNSAQNEHFNVTEAIRNDAPLTTNKSVANSINFDNDYDGAYVIRKPLIKKENTRDWSWTLYNNKNVITISHGSLQITGGQNTVASLHFYDKDLVLRKTSYEDYQELSIEIPIQNVYQVYNAPDCTILSVAIDVGMFYIFQGYRLFYENLHYRVDGFRNANVYRFLKVYKDLEADNEDAWIVEIVHPEFNSITSGLDTDNPNTLDVNLVLDNPYAVRDLYGYGYNSTTKILAYVPYGFSKADIDSKNIAQLTEDVMYVENNTLKGFKVLVSSNPVDIYGKMIILKACLTTAITNMTYYCCWEQSRNGIDWETCPEFITKFQNSSTNTLIEKNVSDVTSADFEKTAYDDSLEKAATYLVTKKLVKLNPDGANADLAYTDRIDTRPDVLILENPDLNLKYRFLLYVDTGKASPVPDVVQKVFTKSYFESVGNVETNLDNLGKFTYQTYIGNGVNADVPEGTTPSSQGPQVVGGSLLLYESGGTNWGNYIVIKNKEPDYRIRDIRITVDNQTFHSSDSNHPTSYYTEKGSRIKYSTGNASGIGTTNVTGGTALNTVKANETTVISTINSTSSTFPGTTQINFGNDSANIPSDELGSDGKWQWRTKIKTIEIVYDVKGGIQSTSVYLASQTGEYQVPYSKATEYLEDISYLRKQLFTGSNMYYYRDQFLFFGNNTLFVTDLGSSIIKLMNTMTFGSPVTNVVSFRNYLLAFTESTITLLKYNYETGTYDSKLLTTSIGVSKVDARTVSVILNSIYFKSKYKVYRLIPNLYASTDDILNIHTVSGPIDKLLEKLLSLNQEISNFTYADADSYMLFIPIRNIDTKEVSTYMFKYDYTKKLWTIHNYPILATDIDIPTIDEAYLKTEGALYYFKDNLDSLLNATLVQDYSSVGYIDEDTETDITVGLEYIDDNAGDVITSDAVLGNSEYESLTNVYDMIPYGDYLNKTLLDIYTYLNNDNFSGITSAVTPISFEIDFGQKSSNYTVDKQFLESKLLFGTLHIKDTFPIIIDIKTDGIQRPLHWDTNTDSALWKNSLTQVGTLSTDFEPAHQEYDGILRQLIVKYSGKGKTIRHLIRGTTKTKFKFYSMDVRSRVLPVKQ